MKTKHILAIVVAALGLHGAAQAAAVVSANYASLSGPTIGFNALTPGPLDDLLNLGSVTFGERFAGQLAGSVAKAPNGDGGQNWFDDLSIGTPTAGLTLLAGAAGYNLGAYDYGDEHGIALAGLGPKSADAVDERFGFGAISARFATAQAGLGFLLRDSDGGDVILALYREDGSLIERISLAPLADPEAHDGQYAFIREGGVADIAGFSLYNRDAWYGISIDDLRIGGLAAATVPEPSTALLLGIALCGLGGARRFGRKR